MSDLAALTKVCTTCGGEFPATTEYFYSSKGRYGVGSRCRPCTAEYTKSRADRMWEQSLMRAYGMTADTYREMLESQGRGCAACGSKDPGKRRKYFSVDHDHKCCGPDRACARCVRGLLCARCNIVEGLTKDSPDLLLNLFAYRMAFESRYAEA